MMLDARRRRLSLLLAAALVACAATAATVAEVRAAMMHPPAAERTALPAVHSPQAADSMARLHRLEAAVAAERAHRYRPGEITSFELASLVNAACNHSGVAVRRLSPLGKGSPPMLAYSLSASSGALVSLVRELSRSEKLLSIPYLRAKAGGRDIDVTMHVSPVVHGVESPRASGALQGGVAAGRSAERTEEAPLLAPSAVALLFGADSPSHEPVAPKLQPAPIAPVQYVAFITTAGERRYVFKERDRGRILVLSAGDTESGYRLLSASADGFLLESNGTRFSVPKNRRSS